MGVEFRRLKAPKFLGEEKENECMAGRPLKDYTGETHGIDSVLGL